MPSMRSLKGALTRLQSQSSPTGSDVVEFEHIARRFPLEVRREVRRLGRSSPRFAELAQVFPGAIYVLASDALDPKRKQALHDMVIEGAPLKAIASALALPMWMRRLPPEAFKGRVPVVPDNEPFTRRISTRLPACRVGAAQWLESVAFAAEAAHEDFAIWLASQPVASRVLEPQRLFAMLAAYAWASRSPDAPSHALIAVRWRPEIAFDTALCAAKAWQNRMRLVLQLPPGRLKDPWLQGGETRGFTFSPLLDAPALLAESRLMHNCADQYADRIAADRSRLFSVRMGEEPVATLEVGQHHREVGVLAVLQLKTRHNLPVGSEVWQAAYAWLAAQPGLKRTPSLMPVRRPLEVARWQDLHAAYRTARHGAPWLATDIDHQGLDRLDRDMGELARLAGVSSWLFN